MSKNYYEILAVSRDATAEQIKKSYRKLARKYHPDVSKEADAEERMQELNVAYDVLSNEAKKTEYDFELDNPQQNAGHHQYKSNMEGQDFSGFEDLFGRFGGGFGGFNEHYESRSSYKGDDQHASLEVDLDVAFNGAIQNVTLQIPTINVYGQAEVQRKVLEIKIPKGMKAGQKIRLAGQGQQGVHGGGNGDLYIEITYKVSDSTYVENTNIYHHLKISPWEAALGQSITASLPNGKQLNIQIPKNTKPGQQLRLKDQGIPAKEPGHLFLILDIIQPVVQSEQEQKAYEALALAFPDFKPRV